MNESIKIIPFPDIDDAYIVISGRPSIDTGNGVKITTSFFYGDGEGGAEWEPNHGPISVIIPCEKDYKGDFDEAKPHWYYPYIKDGLHWSQMAVMNEELPELFKLGYYENIFTVLKTWSIR